MRFLNLEEAKVHTAGIQEMPRYWPSVSCIENLIYDWRLILSFPYFASSQGIKARKAQACQDWGVQAKRTSFILQTRQ